MTTTENQSNKYIRVRFFSVNSELEDLITSHSFEFGATGLSEALTFSQPDLTYDPIINHSSSHDFDVFFDQKPESDYFSRIQEWNPHLKWQISEEDNKDWLAEWKKDFKPFQIVGPYWIVPSWLEVPTDVDAKKALRIDPGMAFGTGTHATTQMASYFVYKLTQAHKELSKKTLLDVGTGTAVLALLASRQGMGRILGLEIDPEARRVARENIKLNSPTTIEISDKALEETHETFDFVVANIIDGVLIQLREPLLKALKPEGEIFLTGILVEREAIFLERFIECSPLQIIRRIEKDEWVGYWLKKSDQ